MKRLIHFVHKDSRRADEVAARYPSAVIYVRTVSVADLSVHVYVVVVDVEDEGAPR